MNFPRLPWLKVAAASALAMAAVAAQAATYTFTLTGDYNASWTLEPSPVPDGVGTNGFGLYDVEGNFPGASEGVVDLIFWTGAIGGGIQIDDFYGDTTLVSTDGPQLFTGTTSAPTFTLGTFALTEFQGSGVYSLSITAVPEPATVMSMLAGLGMIGVALRRRRSETTEA